MRTRHCLFVVAILACWMAATPASAIEFFCNPVDLCTWMPLACTGQPAYNHTDPTQPWVTGGTDEV